MKDLPCKRGFLLPLVLIFLCLMSVMVFSYGQWASHSSRVAFRSEQEELAKRVLESAADEAFFQFEQETARSSHPFAQWLIGFTGNPTIDMNVGSLPRTRDILDDLNQSGVCKIVALSVTFSKRVEDFRNQRGDLANPVPYFGKEGHGTLVLRGTLEILRDGRPAGSFRLERHHDYKVISIVSARGSSGRQSAQNRNLDYLLFVRNGFDEFVGSKGRMLNNVSLKAEFRPHGRGKIYFGGTDDPTRAVFINIGPDQADILPPADGATRPLAKNETDILGERFVKSDRQVEDQITSIMPGDPNADRNPIEFVQKHLADLKIVLNSVLVTFSPTPSEKEKYAREALLKDPNSGTQYDNAEPGIRLIGQGDSPHQVMEGYVRQRFIYMVESEQMTSFMKTVRQFVQGIPEFFISLNTAGYEQNCRRNGGTPLKPIQVICQFFEGLSPAPLKSSTTKLDEDMPYGSKLESERGKSFAPGSLPVDYQPFSFTNLRSFSAATQADLTALGMLIGNTLKLRGAVHVRAPLVLGDGGTMQVEGHGVLSTSSDIIIKGGITCAPDAVLVLVTKGNLIIDTTDRIHAGIVANTVEIVSGKALNLCGALFVNSLGSAQWPPGAHLIEYDPARFFRQSEDLYAVNISPRHTFVRMTAGDH